MGKLSHQQIADEIKEKGFELIDDTDYTNMTSRIIVKCGKGHLSETSLADFRHPSFNCPKCDKNINFINPTAVPAKGNKRRIIAFDQATEKFGLSIFDNGELVFYNLYQFSGDLVTRLVKCRKLVNNIVIGKWEPDFIVMEDIQMQNGTITFKVLSMLLGIIEECCAENNIEYEVVSPNVWRKFAGTCGKTRNEEKKLSVAMVAEKYGIKVTDDVAEAILIGRYGVKMHGQEITMAFGKIK